MTDRELMQQALDAMLNFPNDISDEMFESIRSLRARLAQPEPQEIKIEFKEWLDPHIGVIPINPKTPLILKAVIREEE
jgi:hypothetical protein